MTMEVKVNVDECIGCGICAQFCPEVFEIDEAAGKSTVKAQSDSLEVKNAMEACPVGAIYPKTE